MECSRSGRETEDAAPVSPKPVPSVLAAASSVRPIGCLAVACLAVACPLLPCLLGCQPVPAQHQWSNVPTRLTSAQEKQHQGPAGVSTVRTAEHWLKQWCPASPKQGVTRAHSHMHHLVQVTVPELLVLVTLALLHVLLVLCAMDVPSFSAERLAMV